MLTNPFGNSFGAIILSNAQPSTPAAIGGVYGATIIERAVAHLPEPVVDKAPVPPCFGGWAHESQDQINGNTFQVMDNFGVPLNMFEESRSYQHYPAYTENPTQKPPTVFEQRLPNESCTCDDQTYLTLLPMNAAYVSVVTVDNCDGHVHGYRIICPECNTYWKVGKPNKQYAIPVHSPNGPWLLRGDNCNGGYLIVESTFFAFPFHKPYITEPFDPVPASWRIYNAWTGKYVSDTQGNEDPDHDRAYDFPDKATAIAYAQSQAAGTSGLAKALAAQPRLEDVPFCPSCNRVWSAGDTTCWTCMMASVGPTALSLLAGTAPGAPPTGAYPLSTTRGWCHISPYNAKGQGVAGGITL